MHKNELKDRTKKFALKIMKLVDDLPPGTVAKVIGSQLVRSGTSIGANYRSACRGRSRAEFIAKLGIVLEEADESCFWLELIIDGDLNTGKEVQSLLKEANELTAIFASSARTNKL